MITEIPSTLEIPPNFRYTRGRAGSYNIEFESDFDAAVFFAGKNLTGKSKGAKSVINWLKSYEIDLDKVVEHRKKLLDVIRNIAIEYEERGYDTENWEFEAPDRGPQYGDRDFRVPTIPNNFSFESEEDDEEMPEENFSYESKSNMSQAELMREYVNKIGGEQYHQFGKMGDNGTNTKSPVAGKNDMGGTSQNILRNDTEAGVEANKGNLHGNPVSDQNPKDMSTGNVNVPGGKASKSMKAQSAGHGAERKGKPESADKGAGSPLNGAPKRAK